MHSKTLRRFSGVPRYYASREIANAKELCRRYGGAGAFGSYEEALASDDVDVALVLTPPALHLDWTLRALRAGKDVIVEKPAFLRSSDFDAVEQAARENERRVFVAENYFYKPLAAALRSVISSGLVGEILFVQVNAIKHQRTGDWRDDAALSGAGALFEGGIHWINFVSNLGLTVRSVRGHRPGDHRGIERSMLVTIEYEGGAVGTLAYSWEVPSPLKGVRVSRIFGREGSIAFESNGLFLAVTGAHKRLSFPGVRDLAGYKAMFRDFVDSWRSGSQPQMDLVRARRDLELVEAAYRSAELGQENGEKELS